MISSPGFAIVAVVAAALGIAPLSACGVKGPLKLPPAPAAASKRFGVAGRAARALRTEPPADVAAASRPKRDRDGILRRRRRTPCRRRAAVGDRRALRHPVLRLFARGARRPGSAPSTPRSTGVPHLVCYAVKANSNLAVLNILARLGSGFDIVSGGELARVIAAGGDPAKIVFSGVGKTPAEMEAALAAGIRCFNVESAAELEALDAIACRAGTHRPDFAAGESRRRPEDASLHRDRT